MLMPKKVKHRKQMRGRMTGVATRGSEISFGEYGLKSLEPAWITDRQIEAARIAMTRHIKRGGKIWIRMFPDKPVTKKPAETRMGKGKGAPEYWVAVVKPGRILYEIEGVDETTARDAMARWGVASQRIVIARHGPGQEPDTARRPREDRPRHFLYVGDDEPRKNLATLREAHRRYAEGAGAEALPLVLAGIDELPDAERLAELYSQAAALVHPSLHEGFGLTPLEAMTTGTPVIAARSPGVTEVCGEAALYVDPRDPEDLAQQLTRVAGDPALRSDLGERGRRRAAEFSWARSARCHVEAYTLAALGGQG